MATIFHSVLQVFSSKEEAKAHFDREAVRRQGTNHEVLCDSGDQWIGEIRSTMYPGPPRFFSRWELHRGKNWAWVQYENY